MEKATKHKITLQNGVEAKKSFGKIRVSKHKDTLLRAMYPNSRITAGNFRISNGNEYLNQLKRLGLCDCVWNEEHSFKWWYIKPNKISEVAKMLGLNGEKVA